MLRPSPILPVLLALLSGFSMALAELPNARVRKAVFSDQQLFWPQLQGKAKPEGKSKPTGTKSTAGSKAHQAGGEGAPVHIAVLPVQLKDYRESLPCDSCHRLSANGMEFFLENYLKDKIHDRFPNLAVELVAPNQPLLETKVNLLSYMDSLEFPWSRWLPDSEEQVVYRPHDRFTKAATRKRLDRLGGMLGATHLLVPGRMKVSVTPRSSITHEGGLDWGFSLVLWNVAEGAPEWALQFSEENTHMNLDESLDGHLDKALGAAWDGLPGELGSLWNAEPH
ncbi:MAG: hypothetical protein JWP91_3926 [Fibrobacteres bacterium]|nr:hypothetical protein [Fibrobacterota bacterium]